MASILGSRREARTECRRGLAVGDIVLCIRIPRSFSSPQSQVFSPPTCPKTHTYICIHIHMKVYFLEKLKLRIRTCDGTEPQNGTISQKKWVRVRLKMGVGNEVKACRTAGPSPHISTDWRIAK